MSVSGATNRGEQKPFTLEGQDRVEEVPISRVKGSTPGDINTNSKGKILVQIQCFIESGEGWMSV